MIRSSPASTNLDAARAKFVHRQEKTSTYGGWCDLEADEADLGKGLLDDSDGQKKGVTGMGTMGWFGGRRPTRISAAIPPQSGSHQGSGTRPKSHPQAAVADKRFLGRRVILHTDGARACKMKLGKVIHRNVVHKNRRKIVRGKAWYGVEGYCRSRDP